MRIVLFVEGWTERELPAFLKRWLDPRLEKRPVGLKVVRFEGVSNYLSDVARKARLYLTDEDTLAVFGLLDLYGLPLNLPDLGRDEKIARARQEIEAMIDRPFRDRFHQHFAVHETEAWLLSAPALFPHPVRERLPGKPPEDINFDEPPSKLLDRLWRQTMKRSYKKIVQARNLFRCLDPEQVYIRCPYFRRMMDEMLQVATQGRSR